MLNEYKFNFSQVNSIINKLPEDSKEKIPSSFKNFIDRNSDLSFNEDYSINKFTDNNYSQETLKLLKIVDYYINNDNNKM